MTIARKTETSPLIGDDEMLMEPSPELLKKVRIFCGLSARDASLIIAGATPRWTEYERGTRNMTVHRWLLFLLVAELVTPERVLGVMNNARRLIEKTKPMSGFTKTSLQMNELRRVCSETNKEVV